VLLWYIPGSGGNPGKPTGQVFNANNAGFLLYKGLEIDNSTSAIVCSMRLISVTEKSTHLTAVVNPRRYFVAGINEETDGLFGSFLSKM